MVVYTGESPPPGVTSALFQAGYSVIERPFARDFANLVSELAPKLVVVALDPSQEPDLAVLRSVAADASSPILALSADPSYLAMARVLEAGATVCLPLAAHIDLVSAQARALDRTPAVAPGDASTVAIGDLTVDLARRRVSRGGQVIELTRTEFDLLAVLLRNSGRVLSPVEIASGTGQYVSSVGHARGLVKAHMSHLRQKLGTPEDGGEYISTIRGVGYLLEATPAEGPPSSEAAVPGGRPPAARDRDAPMAVGR